MQSRFSSGLAAASACLLAVLAALPADLVADRVDATLDVRVTGFESNAGLLAIALFANADDYSSQSNAVRRAFLEIRDLQSTWVIEVPQGKYALIAYHDSNGNGRIDMRILGMPKEPVAVSNDARGLFGPPRFEAAKFELTAPLTRHDLKLR